MERIFPLNIFMTINQTIALNFATMLDMNGVDVRNIKRNKDFTAIISASDFGAGFTMGDQDISESIQGVTWVEDCPKTGDKLVIEGDMYIVNSIQKRPTSPIRRFYANLIQKSK